MPQQVRGAIAGRGAAPLAAALAVLPLAAAAGWLAVARPALFEIDLPSSPLALALAALALLAAPAVFLALLRRPALALGLLVVVVYLNLSQVLVRFHGLPSLLQLLALPIAAAGLRLRGRDGTAAVATGDLTLAVLGYLAVLVASTTWAAETASADERVAGMVKATVVYLLVALLAATPRLLRVACRAAVGAGALLAALGVWQALTESFGRDFGGLARIKQAQIYDDVFEPRIAGPLGDPNYFAQILLILVPIALALAWGEGTWAGERGRRRVLAVAAAGLLVAGTVLTYSRGAALALVLVLGLAVLVRGVRPRHVAAGLAVVVILWLFTPAGFARRLTTLREMLPGAEEVLRPDSSFAKRRLVTGAAWRMFLDRPVFGVGAGNYSDEFFRYARRVGSDARLYEEPGEVNYPHNLYLEVAAESGAVGLAAFGALLVAAFASLFTARRRLLAAGDPRTAALAEGVGLALVGLLVTGLFLHGEFPRYLYLLLGLAGGLSLVSRPAGRADREEGPPATGGGPDTTANALAAAPAVRVRRPVAVLLSRFPLVTETFILREVEQLERQGQPVRLVPLIRETPAVVHREAEPWVGRALYTPWLSPPIAAALARAFLRRPLRLFGMLFHLVFGAACSPAILWRSLALLPKAVLLAERLEGEGVRHLHAHFATHPATVALVASRLAGLDFSFTVHAHDLFVDRHLLAWKLRRAAFVRVISRFNRDTIARLYPWAAEKLVVVHVGVDLEGRRPSPEAVEATEPPLVLCVAALKEYKGVAVLVEACRRLREAGVRFRCEVVGEGPLRGELEARIAAAGLSDQVHLLGHRRQDEVARRMAAARVVAQPSVVAADGQMEGIPVALMEALAAERPVVASRLSGIPELVVDGETGLLVPPGDAAALAAALRRLLEDGELGPRLGRSGRELVEREFSLAGTTGELLAVLDRHNPPPTGEEAELAAVAALAEPPALEGQAAAFVHWPAAASGVASPGEADVSNAPSERVAEVEHAEVERTTALRSLVGAGGRAAGEAQTNHGEGQPLGLRRFHRGRDALVAEVLVPGAAGKAPAVRIVKRHLDRPGASRAATERARRETAVAARVAEWDGAPPPLAVDAARGIVVFAPCPGEPLDALVRRLRLRRDGGEELAAAAGAAGRWLARYQATPLADLLAGEAASDLSKTAAAPAAADESPGGNRGSGSVRSRELDDLQSASPRSENVGDDMKNGDAPPGSAAAVGRWPRDLPASDASAMPGPADAALAAATAGLAPGSRVHRRLARLADRALASSFAPVPRHGDLWPGNLRIDDGVARALDFEGASLGPRYADAAWFLLHLDLYLARPGLGRRRRRLASAFLAGWLGDAEAPDEAALAFFRAAAARHLLRNAGGRGLRARWRRRLLAREVSAAAAEGAS
jgi:colanic acid/amylovoran biosynthesis glycosyltransferase